MMFARFIWEEERRIYNGRACPANPLVFAYYLHSIWHLLSAAGHYYWVKGLGQEWGRMEREELEDGRGRRKTV